METPSNDDFEVARVEGLLAERFGVAGPAPATRIGRYAVLDRLGAGAMGVVYRAYDDVLERPIAIKLLHRELDSPSLRERLHREARSMAKLSSVHIATVFEFGEHDGRSFVAMEHVLGQSLRRWQSLRQPWPAVVAAYVQAARGLAAAHEAGVVHRDFKPDNAVIDDRGLVKVLDFGLARTTTSDDPSTLDSITTGDAAVPSTPMTSRGSLVGTLAYMGPELLAGAPADARSDQFALCVSLYEALHGVRPFTGRTVSELAGGIARGVLEAPAPGGPAVPRWLQRILVRGLAADPAGRFGSATALVSALERGQARARRRLFGAIVLVLACVVVAFVVADRWRDARARAACRDEGAHAGGSWNAATRDRVVAAIRASSVGYAETTITHVEPWLDRQAAALEQARTDACVAFEVAKTWDRATLDAATWCLDERRVELTLLVEDLERANASAISTAVTRAARLEPVDACVDVDALRRTPAVPESHREDLAALREQDARARALAATADYEPAAALAATNNARADELGWPPSIASTRLTAAFIAARQDKLDAAERLATDAWFAAASASDWQTAAHAATRLVRIVGLDLVRPDDAWLWARNAELALQLADDRGGLLEADRLDALGTSLAGEGRHTEARDAHAEALAIREATLGTDHPGLAHGLGLLASELGELGDHDAALAMFEREIAVEREKLGADHPDVGTTLLNMGVLARNMGDYESSRRHLEEALAIIEPALGSNSSFVAMCLTNLGIAHRALGDYPRARAAQERALAAAEVAYGHDHPLVATILGNLAGVYDGSGDFAKAKELHLRAIAVLERAVGPDHPHLANEINNFAMLLVDGDEPERGRAMHERALAIFEKALGREHPQSALAWLGIARADRRLGRQGDAIAPAERALEIQQEAGVGVEWIADTQFMLARILWEAPENRGRDRTRAVSLARTARDTYRATAGQAKEVALTQTWLREQGLD